LKLSLTSFCVTHDLVQVVYFGQMRDSQHKNWEKKVSKQRHYGSSMFTPQSNFELIHALYMPQTNVTFELTLDP